ncbi:hypothetical protein MTO96_036169 [Rhipicephalus appendiculatus]
MAHDPTHSGRGDTGDCSAGAFLEAVGNPRLLKESGTVMETPALPSQEFSSSQPQCVRTSAAFQPEPVTATSEKPSATQPSTPVWNEGHSDRSSSLQLCRIFWNSRCCTRTLVLPVNPGILMFPWFIRSCEEDSSATMGRVFVVLARMRRIIGHTSARDGCRNIQAAISDTTRHIGNVCHGATHTVTRALCTRIPSASNLPTPSPLPDGQEPGRCSLP